MNLTADQIKDLPVKRYHADPRATVSLEKYLNRRPMPWHPVKPPSR